MHCRSAQRSEAKCEVSSVSAYETYVDGLMASTFFVLNGLVGCGHMSGLVARRICPLALMKSDDQNPYQICELQLMSHNGLVTPIRACGPAGGQVARGMKRISHKGHRFPLEIIQ